MNFVQGSCEGGSFLSSGPKTVVKKEKKRYDNRWMPFWQPLILIKECASYARL